MIDADSGAADPHRQGRQEHRAGRDRQQRGPARLRPDRRASRTSPIASRNRIAVVKVGDQARDHALDHDAGRAVRRRAVARSQDRARHDDRRSRARRVRRRERQGALAHRARSRAARPRDLARRHARARRVSDRPARSIRSICSRPTPPSTSRCRRPTPRAVATAATTTDELRARCVRGHVHGRARGGRAVPARDAGPADRRAASAPAATAAASSRRSRTSSRSSASTASATSADRPRQIAQHQPRALAWDSAHDALYVAGLGTDSILQIKNASQVEHPAGAWSATAHHRRRTSAAPMASRSPPTATCSCGARSPATSSASTSIDAQGPARGRDRSVDPGPTLVASALTSEQHDGLVLFHDRPSHRSRSAARSRARAATPTRAPTACRGGSTSTSSRRRCSRAASSARTRTSGTAATTISRRA